MRGSGPGQIAWYVTTSAGQLIIGSKTRVDDGAWHHICCIFNNGHSTIYIDGWLDSSATGAPQFGTATTRFGFLGANSEATVFNGDRGGGGPILGDIDDFRIYDKALTQEEIKLAMRGDPLIAWNPSPANGSLSDIENAIPLTWSPGDEASEHDVYFGTDRDAVDSADGTDTTGTYRGRQSGNSYTPPEGVEWDSGPYYWRIDEYNTNATISKGKIWTFTVTDYILIDDFESYTDDEAAGEAIWQHWIDGFDVPNNGAVVGDLLPPYAERTIVHSGYQSMPLSYDNTTGVTNSEAELTLTASRDWTKHGVGVLSLWFRGHPAYVGSLAEDPVGTYTMIASGADIGGTADQFHFAYKILSGPGMIMARVDSITNIDPWAKAGVMIRETLDPGSKYAFVCLTPGNGTAFMDRRDTDANSSSTNQVGITAPHWVILQRDVGGNFWAYHSVNGASLERIQNALPVNIPMNTDVYVGLALTSHNNSAACEAKFSNVTTTGTVSPQWTNQDIGIVSNDPELLYVAVANSMGAPVVVAHDDANAATIDNWTEWVIPLRAFADQGINLSNVDTIAIGVGSKGNMTTPGGSGKMFFDDIRLYRPKDAVGH